MSIVETRTLVLRGFMLAVTGTIIVANVGAQSPSDGNIAISPDDPENQAVEELVREIRETTAAVQEAARRDQVAAPPEEVDRLFSELEAQTSDPNAALDSRIRIQRILVEGMRRDFTEVNPTLRKV
jgi:hypothetical protein